MMTALRLTVQVGSQGWQTHQGLSLQAHRTSLLLKNVLTLLASSLPLCPAVAAEKQQASRDAAIPGSATQVPEDTRSQDRANTVDRGWLTFFLDPSMWWDNGKPKTNRNYLDFVHATTAVGLWIDSCFPSKWVQPEHNSWQDCSPAPGRGARAHYKKYAGASFRSGSTFQGAGRAGNAVRNTLPQRNKLCWAKLISEHTKCGQGREALRIYKEMRDEGVTAKTYTFVAALKACSSIADLEAGKEIHAHVIESGEHSNIFVATTLLDMYVKCGSMADARKVFERMPHRDVVSWNAMIMGYAQKEAGELALQLYARMQHEGFTPDGHTFVAALKACGSLASQEEGKQVDGELVKIGCLEKGRIIHCHVAKSGAESDVFVASTLVDMYAKCGSTMDAHRVFEKMSYRNVVSWNAMIMGYAQKETPQWALQLYARMQHEGFAPNARTFVAALKACGILASLETGKEIHSKICRVGLEGNAFVASCLVDMYGKCGSMLDAQRLFDTSPARCVVNWNALIAGYSHQGDSEHVFDLFERMQQRGIQPLSTTFVSVLTVCSHAGLVDKGQKYFQDMCLNYGITPVSEHYNCMVDLLGRAGQLDEAVEIVKKMPFKPDMVTWMTILGACQKWNNVEAGRHAFECAVRLDEKQAAAYVLMKNIYVSACMWEESAKMKAMRMNARAWKKPGKCWWTDSAGVVHTFVVGDRNHPQSNDIFAKLKDLYVKMEEEGYVPDLDSVLHNMSDDEKEDALCGHSETLAIACALINTPPGTAIRIVKNLQVCGDCHNVTTLISKIEQRVIICRDASRFHVYKEGKCSCGEFWSH